MKVNIPLKKPNKTTHIAIALLFMAILISGRLFWLHTFDNKQQPEIQNGVLDLREWDLSKIPIFTLDGEWMVSPYQLLTGTESQLSNTSSFSFISVPGDWSKVINPSNDSTYGFGSYYLKILVDPEADELFSLRVPSVRSSSAVFVNGNRIGGSGRVGETKENTEDINLPYTSSTIRPDESGVIHLIIQCANFNDPRSSGIARSIKFGLEQPLISDTQQSISLQIMTAVVFLVFALLAIIVYLVGWKDHRLPFFAFTMVNIVFISLSGGEDKLLTKYFTFPYEVTYKLAIVVFLATSLSIVQCVRPQLVSIAPKFAKFFTSVTLISMALGILLPMNYLEFASIYVISYLVFSIGIVALTFAFARKSFNGGFLLFLTLLTILHHYVWWFYFFLTGIKLMYYPFDLILAIILLSTVWFRQYYKTYKRTELYAEKLEAADQAKDEFLANTSHELRNPLNGILNMSQAVLERECHTLQDESLKNLQTVQAVGRRMSYILNDLLDFMSIKEDKPKLMLKPINLNDSVENSIDILQYMIEGKDIHFINEVPNDFPLIYADETKTMQILFNLLHNAIKYSIEGTITVSATTQNGQAIISVEDTGIGMSTQTLKQIFEPYTQDQMTEGGFGLGLSLSKKLVELHDGTLEVQSAEGKGSIFTFNLPLAKSSNIPENHLPIEIVEEVNKDLVRKRTNGRMNHNLKTIKLLVVDDDPINLQVVQAIFSSDDYEVTTALNGQVALDLLTLEQFDIVLSDVMMPNMSGYELTRRIRQQFSLSELPVLLITARNREEDIESGFKAGANDYITKPISAIEIRSRVQSLIAIKQAVNEQLHMESAWLQAQIQPHFLFNTLNSIFALSEIDLERMQKLLEAFNQVLRQKFSFQKYDELSFIQDELEFLKAYLYIEQERFGDRLQIHWDIDDDLDFMIPSLTIQPLVENAIRHGILKKDDGGTVTIRIERFNRYYKITISDDGIGMDEAMIQKILETPHHRSSGVGLRNANLRLIRKYGVGLNIESHPEIGTTISFKVFLSE